MRGGSMSELLPWRRARWWAGGLLACLLAPVTLAQQIDGESLRDPTQPLQEASRRLVPGVQQPEAESYRLDGIIASTGRKQALINGRLRAEGERFGDARVLLIAPDRVVLDIAGQQSILRWKQTATANKKPATTGGVPQ